MTTGDAAYWQAVAENLARQLDEERENGKRDRMILTAFAALIVKFGHPVEVEKTWIDELPALFHIMVEETELGRAFVVVPVKGDPS